MPPRKNGATPVKVETREPAYKNELGTPVLRMVVDRVTGAVVGHFLEFGPDVARDRFAKKLEKRNA